MMIHNLKLELPTESSMLTHILLLSTSLKPYAPCLKIFVLCSDFSLDFKTFQLRFLKLIEACHPKGKIAPRIKPIGFVMKRNRRLQS